MFNSRQQHPIGIDISSRGVCALQLRQTRDGVKVRTMARLPLDLRCTGTDEEIESLSPSLSTLRRSFPFQGKFAVVSLPPEYLATFPVTFETEPHQSVESALVQACRKHLSMPVSEAVIDYMHIQETGTGAERRHHASVVAAPRNRIRQLMRVCHRSGLTVGVIDAGLAALVRLHEKSIGLFETPTILVHMGDENMLLAVVSRSEIIAHRHLNWGMGRLQRRLAENMDIAPDTPSVLKMLSDYGLMHDTRHASSDASPDASPASDGLDRNAQRIVSQILVPCLEDLIHEIYQMIGYTRSQTPDIQFEQICLYGLANTIRDLAPYLHQRLQIPTQGVDPFERLNLLGDSALTDSTARHSYLYALGLSMREAK